jgi:hypothetical protein
LSATRLRPPEMRVSALSKSYFGQSTITELICHPSSRAPCPQSITPPGVLPTEKPNVIERTPGCASPGTHRPGEAAWDTAYSHSWDVNRVSYELVPARMPEPIGTDSSQTARHRSAKSWKSLENRAFQSGGPLRVPARMWFRRSPRVTDLRGYPRTLPT